MSEPRFEAPKTEPAWHVKGLSDKEVRAVLSRVDQESLNHALGALATAISEEGASSITVFYTPWAMRFTPSDSLPEVVGLAARNITHRLSDGLKSAASQPSLEIQTNLSPEDLSSVTIPTEGQGYLGHAGRMAFVRLAYTDAEYRATLGLLDGADNSNSFFELPFQPTQTEEHQ